MRSRATSAGIDLDELYRIAGGACWQGQGVDFWAELTAEEQALLVEEWLDRIIYLESIGLEVVNIERLMYLEDCESQVDAWHRRTSRKTERTAIGFSQS